MNIPIIIDSENICNELNKIGAKTKTTFSANADEYDAYMSEVNKAMAEIHDRISNEIFKEVSTEFDPRIKTLSDKIESYNDEITDNKERIRALSGYKKFVDPDWSQNSNTNESNNNSQPETFGNSGDTANAANREDKMDYIVDALTSAGINSNGPPTVADIDTAIEHYRSENEKKSENITLLADRENRLAEEKWKEYDARFNKAVSTTIHKEVAREFNVFYPFPTALSAFIQTDYGQRMTGKTNLSSLINALPKVRIHSYFITTPLLESMYNVYSWFDGVRDGIAIAKNCENLAEVFKNFFNGITSKNGLATVIPTLTKDIIDGDNLNQNDLAIKSLPEILYYRLYTTERNNTYIIPCLLESDYYSSNGNYGWGKGNEYSGEPILAKVIKNASLNSFLSRSLGFSIMPMFNTSGGGAPGNSVIISFDLVNENIERAKANTEFIRSLVLSNKRVQVGLGQLPGNLYDVSIPGTGQRWFMCTADIRVQHKGALRHLHHKSDPLPGAPASEKNKCRIPDAYNVRITFESLLPDNLNQMLIAKDKDNQIFMKNRSVFPKLLDNVGEVLKNITAVGEENRQNAASETTAEGAAPKQSDSVTTMTNSGQIESNVIRIETNTTSAQNPDNANEIAKAVENSDPSANPSPSSLKPTIEVDCPKNSMFDPSPHDNIELEVLKQYNPDIIFLELPVEVQGDKPGEVKTVTRFFVSHSDPNVAKISIKIPAGD